MASNPESRFSLAEWGAIWSVVLVWGLNNAAGKFAVGHIPPLLVGGARFAVALIFLLPFIKPPLPPLKSFLPVILLVGPIHFGVVYWGFALVDNLSLFGVTLQLWVPMTAAFSWLILKETMPRPALVGMGLAFAGVAYMSLDPTAAADVDGILVGIVASLFWALGTVLVRRLPPIRALKLQGCVALVSAPTLILASLLFEPQAIERAQAASVSVWASVVFAGLVSSVGATVMLFWLVQRHSAGRFTPYLLCTPLVTTALGVSLFGDVLTPRLIVGAVVTLAGVALVALAERRRPGPAPEPA